MTNSSCCAILATIFKQLHDARWLQKMMAEGDVIAESRGKQDDQRLKASFERIYVSGSDFVESDVFTSHLTSRQLKVKTKRTNIAGLQLADLIAHPSFSGTLARRDHRPLPDTFGGKGQLLVIEIYPSEIDSDKSTDLGMAFDESWQRNEPGYRYLAEH